MHLSNFSFLSCSGKKFKISWKTQGIYFLKNVVTLYLYNIKNLCKMAESQTFNCCYLYKAGLLWLKLCNAFVTRYVLPYQKNFPIWIIYSSFWDLPLYPNSSLLCQENIRDSSRILTRFFACFFFAKLTKKTPYKDNAMNKGKQSRMDETEQLVALLIQTDIGSSNSFFNSNPSLTIIHFTLHA